MSEAIQIDSIDQLQNFLIGEEIVDKASFASRLPMPVEACEWEKEELPPIDPVLEGGIDMGTKNMLAGPSKQRKSFCGLQMALALAAGEKKFLDWNIPKPRRVLVLQLEITEAHYQKRVKWVRTGLGIGLKEIKNNLHIINGRGCYLDATSILELIDIIEKLGIEVVIIDPIYKLLDDENSAEAVKPLLAAFDKICQDTGVAIVYVHHYGKGRAGDRDVIDRAVGSGVLGRDFDCGIFLSQHVDDDLTVLNQIARSYPPKPACSIRFNNDKGIFELDETPPIVRTSSNHKQNSLQAGIVNSDDVISLLRKTGPLPKTVLHKKVRDLGFTDRDAKATIDQLVHKGEIKLYKETKEHGCLLHGLPEQLDALEKAKPDCTQRVKSAPSAIKKLRPDTTHTPI